MAEGADEARARRLGAEVLAEAAAAIQGTLDGLYRGGGRCDRLLDEAARYSLLSGGKRVRPALTLEFCRLFGGDPDGALPFAAAIEMIHTFSLIHDDLPCMDDDGLRRGRPSNHAVFGEAMALLAGDALALDAFGLVASNAAVPAGVRADAARALSQAAGSGGMTRGQAADLFGETHDLSYEELLSLHARKTGALIRAAAQLGCLAAGKGAGSPEMAAAEAYADRVGLAFQILDDILDAAGPDVSGRPSGGSEARSKRDFLSFRSVGEARNEAARLTAEAVARIAPYDGSERLAALALFLASRGS